jgi:hypothetical protein
MPRPDLTRHVRERMEARDISDAQIFEALAHEIRRTPGQPGTVWIHGTVAGGETLKVRISVDKTVVITAAWPDR